MVRKIRYCDVLEKVRSILRISGNPLYGNRSRGDDDIGDHAGQGELLPRPDASSIRLPWVHRLRPGHNGRNRSGMSFYR